MAKNKPGPTWFEQKVWELKAELGKLPADRRAQLMRELEGEAAREAVMARGTPAPPPLPADRLLTPAEAAALLSVSKSTIVAWRRKGKIPGIKIERVYRFSESVIRKMAAGGEDQASRQR